MRYFKSHLLDFNSIIIAVLSDFFYKHDFLLIENSKDFVCFKSNNVTIRFIYSPYGWECRYDISLNNEKVEYENFFVEDFLKLPKQRLHSTDSAANRIKLWAVNQLNLFEKYPDDVLKGEKEFYSKLNEYYNKRNSDYTKKMS